MSPTRSSGGSKKRDLSENSGYPIMIPTWFRDSVPIEYYHCTADNSLKLFLKSYENLKLDNAYKLGKQYISFTTYILPTHLNYRLSQYHLKKLRNDNILKRRLVKKALEDIVINEEGKAK